MSNAKDWFDGLADPARAPDGDRPELDAIRRAARALDTAPVDELALQRLLRRVADEAVAPPPARRLVRRAPAVATAAVVLLSLSLLIERDLPPPRTAAPPPQPAVGEALSEPPRAAPARGAGAQRSMAMAEAEADDAGPLLVDERADAGAPETRREAAEVRASAKAAAERPAAAFAGRAAPAAPALRSDVPRRRHSPDPAAALAELRRLAAADPDLQIEAGDAGAPPWQLTVVCRAPAACATLQAWLGEAAAADAGLPVGRHQVLIVRRPDHD